MLKQWSIDRKFNEFIYFRLRKLLSVPIAAPQAGNASFFMGEILILLFLYVSSELFLWLRWHNCDIPVLEENSDLSQQFAQIFICPSVHEQKPYIFGLVGFGFFFSGLKDWKILFSKNDCILVLAIQKSPNKFPFHSLCVW